MKKRNWFDEYPVIGLDQRRMEEVIRVCPEQKMESSNWRIFLQLLQAGEGKLMKFPLIFSFFCLFVPLFFHLEKELIFLIIVSSFFSLLFVYQLLQSKNATMWELEHTCKIGVHQILIYRILMLAFINLVVFFCLGILFFFKFHTSIFLILLYEFLPFFLIGGILLNMSTIFRNRIGILMGYLLGLLLVFRFYQRVEQDCSNSFLIGIFLIVLGYFIVSLRSYQKVMEKKGGNLQWN